MAWNTLNDVYIDVRFRSNKTSTDLSDATLLPIANKVLREIMAVMIGLGEGWFGEIGTFNIVANQREYTLPADSTSTPWGGGSIKLLKLELKLDGTNWTDADAIPFESIASPYNETDIIARFDNGDPKYSVFDESVFIWSGTISAVTTGGRYIYVKREAEITSTSAAPALPNEFLSVLADGMLRDVYQRFNQIDMWREANGKFEQQLERVKGDLSDRAQEAQMRMQAVNQSFQ